MQISVDVWALADKVLRDDPNKSSAVYWHCIYWLLMINTLFVEQIPPKSTSLPKIFSAVLLRGGDFRLSVGRKEKDQVLPICRYETNEPWGFQTPPYDDTKGITDMKKGKNRGKELTNWCEWIFHQLAAKKLNVNALQRSIASVIRYSIGQKTKWYL